MTMDGRVLVAYATKHGATGAIAETIGSVLRERGLEVEVRPVAEVADVSGYKAVVLGSALYMFHWQKEAMRFLKRHEAALRERPTWLFSCGPTGGSEEADAAVAAANASATDVAPIKEVTARAERIGARGHATFAGRIGPEMTGFFERWMPRGDWLEPGVVNAWAEQIAGELAVAKQPVGAP